MSNFKKINNYMGWVVFAISALVYFLTIQPTASWWDPGEYLSISYKLQVGHPPGAPLFQLLGRFFSLFAFGNRAHVAVMINSISALASAFAVMFLFWTITILARKIYGKKMEDEFSKGQLWAIIGAGLVGSLAFTFSDSFWFSAVEAEVYASSIFITALTFWAILRWEEVADHESGFRWLLLIAYLTGLAIGIHLLNLLTIPAIVYVYYFKKYKFSWKGFIGAGFAGVFILAIVMYGVIRQAVNLAGLTELFFVNSLGLPFNSGTIFYFIVLIGLIFFGLRYTRKKGKVVLNAVILGLTFILIGYSSFLMLVIRSNADTPINEDAPKDAVSLLSYLNRQQYGTWPLLYGQYYDAPQTGTEYGSSVYKRNDKTGKYDVVDRNASATYDPRFETIFPRMWSGDKPSYKEIYQSQRYGGTNGTPITVNGAEEGGKPKTLIKPSFLTNLKFFLTYQVDHMYWRYFMWNFVGRQNDIEGQGEIDRGNWISGIPFIDNWRLGNQSDLPPSMHNPARTRLYFLPLILGLLGFFFHLKRNKKDTWVVFVLFFMTGLAIVIYLNQTPLQPRERDYSYVGSFYAFAIWIGLGILALYEKLEKYFKKKELAALTITAVSLILVPANMAKQEWHSHDRSGRYACRDFAVMYLESCPPNAILFTNGDNDTFPLWYAQEVEGIRTDVRVVNYMLASGSWYTDQMFKQEYNSAPLPLSLSSAKYDLGSMDYVPVYPMVKGEASLKDAIAFIASDDPRTKIELTDGRKVDFMPTKELVLKVDSAAAVNSGTVSKKNAGDIVKEIHWTIRQNGLYRSDVMLLDLIATNNWKRPICFDNPSAVSKVLDVAKYCHMEGVIYQFKPTLAKDYINGMGGVDMDNSYKILMNPNVRWGRLNEPDVNVDRESDRNSTLGIQSYVRLAQALVTEHRYDSAVKVLDKEAYFFPESKFPYDYFTIQQAWMYYQCGAVPKANKMVDDIYTRYMQDLDYYNGLQPRFFDFYTDNIREALSSLQQLVQLTKTYKQDSLSEKINKSLYAQLKLLKAQ
ncbi:MAG: DUF2723 domain-containing protein [Bacteroidales bacterium]|nr:DUF2723 domain-containing protein [Bacteroidales bacterium]